MRHALVAVIALIALALPAGAAALTPTAPVDSATGLGEHPVFAWSLDGHEPNVIAVSRAQRTTPEGEFYDEDREGGDALRGTDTSWAPTSAIPAGRYWWNVQWFAPDYSASGWTSPSSFTIPTRLRAQRLRVPTLYSFAIYADVSWWSNTRSSRLVAELYIGTRRAARRVEFENDQSIAARNDRSVRLGIPRWARGKRGVVRVAVTSDGLTVRAARAVTVPRA